MQDFGSATNKDAMVIVADPRLSVAALHEAPEEFDDVQAFYSNEVLPG